MFDRSAISKFLRSAFFLGLGKPELPRQPGSTAQYEAKASKSEPSSDSAPTEPDSPQSSATEANFFHTLDWQGTMSTLLLSCLLYYLSLALTGYTIALSLSEQGGLPMKYINKYL